MNEFRRMHSDDFFMLNYGTSYSKPFFQVIIGKKKSRLQDPETNLLFRKTPAKFSHLSNLYTVFSSCETELWLWGINERRKQVQSTEHTEDAKLLPESWIVFRCVLFHQSDFDKPIMLAFFRLALIAHSLARLFLAVQHPLCLTGFFICLQPTCHISPCLTECGWGPWGRNKVTVGGSSAKLVGIVCLFPNPINNRII